MTLTAKRVLALFAAVGSLLQIGGVAFCFRSGWAEVNLFIGLVLFALGTPLTVFGIERYLQAIGRADRWAFVGLFGPLGVLLVTRLKPGATAARAPSARPRSRADRWVAWALTALILAAWLGAAALWLQGHRWPPPVSVEEMKENERLAYQRLKLIVTAQAAYRERDWDGDGQQTYALFLIHLWQSVDLQGQPVAVDLISRELGLAMVQPFALDGYYFQSLHKRTLSSEEQAALPAKGGRAGFRDIHPDKEWGVAAIPKAQRETGLRVLVADETGAIWTPKTAGAWVTVQVSEPAKRGWIEVKSLADLVKLQGETTYPEPSSSARR